VKGITGLLMLTD